MTNEGSIEVPISQIKIGQRVRKNFDGVLDLANSIKKIGLLEPIVVREIKDPIFKYELLAGHTRIQAFNLLRKTDIPIVVRNNITKPVVAELHENEARKNFDPAERIEAIRRVEALYKENQKLGIKQSGSKNDIISKETGIPKHQVTTFQKVYNAFASNPQKYGDLQARLESKKTSLEQAYKTIRRDEMHKKWEIPKLPDGKFDVILCDPIYKESSHYNFNKGMGVTGNELAHLDVEKCSADDCILLMWTTAYKLPSAITALQSWKFAYKTHAVLVRNAIGNGFYFRPEHELLLIAEKGDMPIVLEKFGSVIKPDPILGEHHEIKHMMYPIIERMYPNRSYLTMFSNVERPGWTSWNVRAQVSRPRADRHRH